MRAVIRDLRTGCFYAPDGQWTAERGRGCEFESTFQALAFAEENRLDGVEIVLTFGRPEQDLTICQDLNRLAPTGNLLSA